MYIYRDTPVYVCMDAHTGTYTGKQRYTWAHAYRNTNTETHIQ